MKPPSRPDFPSIISEKNDFWHHIQSDSLFSHSPETSSSSDEKFNPSANLFLRQQNETLDQTHTIFERTTSSRKQTSNLPLIYQKEYLTYYHRSNSRDESFSSESDRSSNSSWSNITPPYSFPPLTTSDIGLNEFRGNQKNGAKQARTNVNQGQQQNNVPLKQQQQQQQQWQQRSNLFSTAAPPPPPRQSLRQRYFSLEYPLINYERESMQVSFPASSRFVQVNGFPVSSEILYTCLLKETLSLQILLDFDDLHCHHTTQIRTGNPSENVVESITLSVPPPTLTNEEEEEDTLEEEEEEEEEEEDTQEERKDHHSNCKVLKYLEREEVEDYIMERVMIEIDQQRGIHKKSTVIFKRILKVFKEHLFVALTYGIFKEFLKLEEIKFLLSQDLSNFALWSEYMSSHIFSQYEQEKSQESYKPWLLIIRETLERLEQRDKNLAKFSPEEKGWCIQRISKWLDHPDHRNLICWLIQFIFTDYFPDIKRQLLFMEGPPHVGKTMFLKLLLNPKFFSTRYLGTEYFSSEKKGDYYHNCVIFDDPGETAGRTPHTNRNLDSEWFLRLARGGKANQYFDLNTKNGFIRIHKAQICIISNHSFQELYPKRHIPALMTRLLPLKFTYANPFPLATNTSESKPFVYNPLFAQTASDRHTIEEGGGGAEEEDPFVYPPPYSLTRRCNSHPTTETSDLQEQEDPVSTTQTPFEPDATYKGRPIVFQQPKQQPEESQLIFHQTKVTFTSSAFTDDTIFWFLWQAILNLLEHNISLQDQETIARIFDYNFSLIDSITGRTQGPANNRSLFQKLVSLRSVELGELLSWVNEKKQKKKNE